jgi:hypothetical protein
MKGAKQLAPLGAVEVGEHFYLQLFENRRGEWSDVFPIKK